MGPDVWNEWLAHTAASANMENGLFKTDASLTTTNINEVITWFRSRIKATITDPVASYVMAHTNGQDEPAIIDAIAKTFTIDELNNTKAVLNDAGLKPDGRAHRQKVDLAAEDIVKTLKRLDNSPDRDKYRFIITDEQINKLPKFTPGELSNPVDVAIRVGKLEIMMDQLSRENSDMQARITKQDIVQNTQHQQIQQQTQDMRNIRNMKAAALDTRIMTGTPGRQHAPPIPNRGQNNPSEIGADTPNTKKRKAEEAADGKIGAASTYAQILQENPSDWSDVNRRKPRKTAIQGNKQADANGLIGGTENIDLVVSGLRPKDDNIDQIINWVKSESGKLVALNQYTEEICINKDDCALLGQPGIPRRTECYKISINRKHKDLIVNADFWPVHVYIRDYIPPRRAQNGLRGGTLTSQPPLAGGGR